MVTQWDSVHLWPKAATKEDPPRSSVLHVWSGNGWRSWERLNPKTGHCRLLASGLSLEGSALMEQGWNLHRGEEWVAWFDLTVKHIHAVYVQIPIVETLCRCYPFQSQNNGSVLWILWLQRSGCYAGSWHLTVGRIWKICLGSGQDLFLDRPMLRWNQYQL